MEPATPGNCRGDVYVGTMTREEQINSFDPNGPGLPGQLFGLPFNPATAKIVVIPMPWEATVTYHVGTADAPEQIISASRQIDVFAYGIPDAWKMGVAALPSDGHIRKESASVRHWIAEMDKVEDPEARALLQRKVNESCEHMNIFVRAHAERLMAGGKIPALLGGDHSTPLGLIRALAGMHSRFGILQIDAHADLRKSYLGHRYSHGSVMYNALKLPSVSKLVQVGIRDWCAEEQELVKHSNGRIRTWQDEFLRNKMDEGSSWDELCRRIVSDLPERVYVSFDIDGLDPSLCPHTGTPVPGGLTFHQVTVLLRTIATSRRRIIGFDLNEVGPGSWDANVGARMLWQLCNWTGVSQDWLTYLPER